MSSRIWGLAVVCLAQAAANATDMMIRGPSGASMTAAEFQKAKQAHRSDPANNPDPAATLGLRKNMGYDVKNGRVGPWRTHDESVRRGSPVNADLDRVIGHFPNGSVVTLRELVAAQEFHKRNPKAPKPEALQLAGTSYTSSVSRTSDENGVRMKQVRFEAKGPGSTAFCVPVSRQGVVKHWSVKADCAKPSDSPEQAASSVNLLGLSLGMTMVLGATLRAKQAKQKSRLLRRSAANAVVEADRGQCLNMTLEPVDSVYEQLPTFEDATGSFYGLPSDKQHAILLELRALLMQYELEQVVGVDIKHRHFSMGSGQVLLETQDVPAKESVMRAVLASQPMVPFSFVLLDGKWVPYEFVEESCTSAKTGLTKVRACNGFLEDFAGVVKRHGLQHILGFNVLHREHLGGEAKGTLETPGHAANELRIRPYTAELVKSFAEKAACNRQVGWSWSRMSMEGFCGVHRCSHCHHCGSHCVSHQKH